MIVTIKNEYFHKRHKPTGLQNRQEICSVWIKNRASKYNLVEI